jgi:membrane protein implicated in regulation of membrane protease activity
VNWIWHVRKRLLLVELLLGFGVFTAAIVVASLVGNPNGIFVVVLLFILIMPTSLLSTWFWTKLLGSRKTPHLPETDGK